MMSRAEHYAEAERLAVLAARHAPDSEARHGIAAVAQVHATLAGADIAVAK